MARAPEGGRADGLPGFAVVQPRDCTLRRRLSAFGAGRSTDAGRHGDPSSLREHRRHRRRVCRASARGCRRNYHHKRHVSCRTPPSHHRICHAVSAADDLRYPDLCAEWGVNLLRGRLSGYPSARRIICRSHSAWCAAWRLAGSGTSQIHAVDQSQGCTSNRSRPAAVAHYSCRRGDRMRRREFITLLGGTTLWPLAARGQTPSIRRLIAAEIGGSKTGTDRDFSGFSQGMRELGYVEGHDYGFEVRYADGNASRISPQMEELVRLKPDIIVSATTAGVIAAKKLTDTIPIVCENLTNPIEFGVAASYARPGGNVTGVLLTVEDLPTKMLELALEVISGANKIGLLVHPDNPIQPVFQRSLDVAVNALGIELTVLEIVSPDDLHTAFRRLA